MRYSRAATAALQGEQFDIRHNQGGCALRSQDVITAHSCHREWWTMKFRNHETARALLNPRHRSVLHVEAANYRPGTYAKVIAVSDEVAQQLRHHYQIPESAITVVPNGVDTAAFQPSNGDALRHEVRTRHGFAESDLVLLFVGKEFRRKGLAHLIDALPALPRHVKVLVVGGDDSGPFRDRSRKLGVADRVVFAGHTDRVESYFQAGDVFAFPTLYEPFGLVAAEAASAGLPLLSTEALGVQGLLVEGESGLRIEREAASITSAVHRMDRDPALRARMGDDARRRAQAFSWDEVARRTLEVYQDVAAQR